MGSSRDDFGDYPTTMIAEMLPGQNVEYAPVKKRVGSHQNFQCHS